MLGIIRANNDLVIFVLLAFALWSARADAGWRMALTILALALATGLKFYPAVAGIIFLFVRAPQRRMVALVVAGLTIAATLAIVGRQIARGTFHIEPVLIEALRLSIDTVPSPSCGGVIRAHCGRNEITVFEQQDP